MRRPIRKTRRRSARRQIRGFTLIEMLAAVMIFALLAGLVAPNIGSVSARTLRQRGESIAARLELARQRSVVTGVPHRVLLDLEEGGYRLEWLVTEAESLRARGEEPEPDAETEPLDLRGSSPLPLRAPRQAERAYRPVPGLMGRFVWLEESLGFDGLETSEGWIDRGDAFIGFDRDGTTSYTALFLGDEDGNAIVLDVLPMADFIRVSDAEG